MGTVPHLCGLSTACLTLPLSPSLGADRFFGALPVGDDYTLGRSWPLWAVGVLLCSWSRPYGAFYRFLFKILLRVMVCGRPVLWFIPGVDHGSSPCSSAAAFRALERLRSHDV
jgi:hypothetical protein